MNNKYIFILLAFSYLIFSIAISIISPFFPAFAATKGISEIYVGIIFSANPLGAVLSAMILGKILNEVIHFLI